MVETLLVCFVAEVPDHVPFEIIHLVVTPTLLAFVVL